MTPEQFLINKATDRNVAFTSQQWAAIHLWMTEYATHQNQSEWKEIWLGLDNYEESLKKRQKELDSLIEKLKTKLNQL